MRRLLALAAILGSLTVVLSGCGIKSDFHYQEYALQKEQAAFERRQLIKDYLSVLVRMESQRPLR